MCVAAHGGCSLRHSVHHKAARRPQNANDWSRAGRVQIAAPAFSLLLTAASQFQREISVNQTLFVLLTLQNHIQNPPFWDWLCSQTDSQIKVQKTHGLVIPVQGTSITSVIQAS
jgi:hypothetical protein